MSSDILNRIVAYKKEAVAAGQQHLPLSEIKARLPETPAVRNFAAALRPTADVALIAEVKRRSPSRGVIRNHFNLANIVAAYRDAGADAVSVLTDSEFFGGSPNFLAAARQLTNQPLLRKDFILNEYQVYESRFLGADAVLLITGILPGGLLGELLGLTRSLGMEALVETRDADEIDRALAAGARVVGINNRDLNTFKVELNNTVELARYITAAGTTLVSESGIKTRTDVEMLGVCGVHAVLVGETLMSADNLQSAVRRLKGLEPVREVSGV